MRTKYLAVIFLVIAAGLLNAETIVERSPFLKYPGFLGTGSYCPLPAETAFFAKISDIGRGTVFGFSATERAFFESDFFRKNNPKATPETINAEKPNFSLTGHVGEYVSWFGILRKSEQNGPEFRLIIQNKYSTGMSDLHIQTVSIFGAGDFEAVVRRSSLDVLPLVLVKVYGKVIRENGGRPEVDVDYLRIWDWMHFNFSDYGEDKKLSAYDKELDIAAVRVYSSRVDPYYYPKRIQATREQLDQIGRWIADNRDAINKDYQEAQKEGSNQPVPSTPVAATPATGQPPAH